MCVCPQGGNSFVGWQSGISSQEAGVCVTLLFTGVPANGIADADHYSGDAILTYSGSTPVLSLSSSFDTSCTGLLVTITGTGPSQCQNLGIIGDAEDGYEFDQVVGVI